MGRMTSHILWKKCLKPPTRFLRLTSNQMVNKKNNNHGYMKYIYIYAMAMGGELWMVRPWFDLMCQ